MERERKRRQLKTAGGENKTSFIQTAKLGLMNSGLISLKKGENWNKMRKSGGLLGNQLNVRLTSVLH